MLHDSFFLSEYKVLNLFICGIGTVGGMLLEQIRTQQKFLMQSRRLKLNVVGISDVDNFVLDRDGIDLDNYEKILRAGFAANTDHMRDEIVKMNIFNSVFVDCTASRQIAALYQTFLEHNISVVAANKIAASSDYDSYIKLRQTARDRGVWFRYETNVGAGLPWFRKRGYSMTCTAAKKTEFISQLQHIRQIRNLIQIFLALTE